MSSEEDLLPPGVDPSPSNQNVNAEEATSSGNAGAAALKSHQLPGKRRVSEDLGTDADCVASIDDDTENTCSFPKDAKRCVSSNGAGVFSDLIVLGLPFITSDVDFRRYFENFGAVTACQIKRDDQGKSRGFGFVQFESVKVQEEVLATRYHQIDGRQCEIKVPASKGGIRDHWPASKCSERIFVGHLPSNCSEEKLRKYFETYGSITNVYFPKQFRNWAFVTFSDQKVAQSLVGKELTMESTTINIASARYSQQKQPPKQDRPRPATSIGYSGSSHSNSTTWHYRRKDFPNNTPPIAPPYSVGSGNIYNMGGGFQTNVGPQFLTYGTSYATTSIPSAVSANQYSNFAGMAASQFAQQPGFNAALYYAHYASLMYGGNQIPGKW